jgi:phospholipid/cholesterol/gamma-HCH transport system permease protein
MAVLGSVALQAYFGRLGERFVAAVSYIGGVALLLGQTAGWLVRARQRHNLFVGQLWQIGLNSLPIVFLTALFTGMVLALQSAYQMQKIGAGIYIASLVALSMTRELGPVLTALVIAGRVGASITAELGTMKVTEQIDALQAMATDPVKYLVMPRFAALVTMLPLLTIYADGSGIIGGALIGVYKLGLGSTLYWRMTFDPLMLKDVTTGLIKSVVFAAIICTVACYEGFRTEGGAEGVGRATTRSVVTAFILIVGADCLLTALFYFVFR